MDESDNVGPPTEWAFTLMALMTAPAWLAMAWYWQDVFPLLAGVVCQAFGIYEVYKADWRA